MMATIKNIQDTEFFKNNIANSGTWNKLTNAEQESFLNMPQLKQIKGTIKMRTEWLNAIYYAYLLGLGYKPIGWREEFKNCYHCRCYDMDKGCTLGRFCSLQDVS